MNQSYQIKSLADLMNIVTLENHKRLSDDMANLLHSFAEIKNREDEYMFVTNDYQITWTDDGVIKTNFSIKIVED